MRGVAKRPAHMATGGQRGTILYGDVEDRPLDPPYATLRACWGPTIVGKYIGRGNWPGRLQIGGRGMRWAARPVRLRFLYRRSPTLWLLDWENVGEMRVEWAGPPGWHNLVVIPRRGSTGRPAAFGNLRKSVMRRLEAAGCEVRPDPKRGACYLVRSPESAT